MSERTSKTAAKGAAIMDMPLAAAAPDLGRAAGAMLDGWSALSGHLMGLAQSSMQVGLEAAEDLRRCQSPQELLDAQIRHSQRACAAYFDGLREVGGLLARTSSDALDALNARAS